MPHPAAHAPTRFITLLGEIVGSEWTPPDVPNWPVNFTRPAADLALTVYPQRRNSRIVFTTASLTAPDRRCHVKYTPDLAGHDSIDAWLADGDLDAVTDALTVIVRRLVDQPLPDPVVPHPDPVGREMEYLAEHAQELARLTAQFAAGLIRGEALADQASRIAALAQQTEQSAIRVDELRGPAPATRA
ncbi:hypothetical protein OG599_34775 (plasmid) [Streptomyces sp. NBC_01335]|uniref:hypothetical protein n=1 Tax=Streptomyces sp. NBC_01335 TaxID=2903828 RepID=UPI002E0DE8A2|nr:hypothetical protein OG599_34775 [Streptomyces sp. NBC_01335]